MITFGQLVLEPTWLPGLHGRRLYRVVYDCPVWLNGAPLCVIRAGFLTDKTSWLPCFYRLMWITTIRRWIRDRRGRYTLSSVLHDWLLCTATPKWLTDLLYKMALRATGVSALEAWLFGSMVRVKRTKIEYLIENVG